MKSLCVQINAAKGFVDTFQDTFIADLRMVPQGVVYEEVAGVGV